MKFYLSLMAVQAICQVALARFNITCFYDTFSINRGGSANFTENDMRTSLEYCNNIVYGYVGFRPDTFEVNNLHPKQHLQFTQVKQLKKQYRHIKFFVSLGGDKDLVEPEKYVKLLEAQDKKQKRFVQSALNLLRKYNFDGLDLAYQFPRDKPKEQKSRIKSLWNKAKKLTKTGGGDSEVTERRLEYGFNTLLHELRNTLNRNGLKLTLTVLPQVNATKYLNIDRIIHDLDFVNLGTFDYSMPDSSPHSADYYAPIYAPFRTDKHSSQLSNNIDFQVRQWLSHRVSPNKLNIGIATYGRTWRMTKILKSNMMPINSSLDGPAQGGELTHTPGLLSWPEICLKLPKMSKSKDKKFGNFAYRSPDVRGSEGMLITYEDSDSVSAKAEYVQSHSLGGVALFDLSLDDFRGKCKDGIFPLLKTIKFKFY